MSAVSPLNPRLEALRTGFLARDHQLFVDGRWAAAQSGRIVRRAGPRDRRAARARRGRRGRRHRPRGQGRAQERSQSGPWPRLTHAERAKAHLQARGRRRAQCRRARA